jgi:hypothetical protein
VNVLSRLAGVLAATACVAVVGSGPANATLAISVNGTTEATSATNTSLIYSGALPGKWFNLGLGILGAGDLGGNDLMDVSANISTKSTNAGALVLKFTETDLTGSAVEQFISDFTAGTTNPVMTRSFWLDTSNSGGESILLSSTTVDSLTSTSPSINLSGLFSLVEEIDFNEATRKSTAKLSSDDDVTGQPIPEPLSLSLFGAGLLGLGATMRRRKAA